MDEIRDYLEKMFAGLPDTPETARAKEELGQMMEDKFTELIQEGRNEKVAAATVISEFGNLEELSEALGIDLTEPSETDGDTAYDAQTDFEDHTEEYLSFEDVLSFLRGKRITAQLIAIGVLLCIISPIGCILSDGAGVDEALGLIFLFLSIACAVGLFLFSGIISGKWKDLEKKPFYLDEETVEYIKDQKESYRITFTILLVFGIILCILSALPAAIFDTLNLKIWRWDSGNLGGMFVLVIVAVGVYLIISGSITYGAYGKLLELFQKFQKEARASLNKGEDEYGSRFRNTIMASYWTIVVCIYLLWSFVTGLWNSSWLIWPLAALLHKLLKSIWKSDGQKN